jgi:hypothetical protein
MGRPKQIPRQRHIHPRAEEHKGSATGSAVISPRSRGLGVPPSPWLALLTLIIILCSGGAATAQQTDEYRVKAAFLFHFAQLVDWPADLQGDESKPLTLCTIGPDPFGGDLDTTLRGKSIGTRALQIRHLKQAQEIEGCHVLFIAGRDRKQVAPLLSALKDTAVLTVGESDDFVKQGGMIGFCMENNKVRFDINVDAAARVKLKLSSRLLLLAKSVIGNHT